MSLINRLLKANPSAQVSSMLTGSFVIPSAKLQFTSIAFNSAARGVFALGYAGGYSNVLDYVTIATTGNATDFGDLTVARAYTACCSSSTRGIITGGSTTSGDRNTIDFVTIATVANATDFGDLEAVYTSASGTSNGHGGLS